MSSLQTRNGRAMFIQDLCGGVALVVLVVGALYLPLIA
jgi:succinate dehydrogenase hydrophobic anchor subunit